MSLVECDFMIFNLISKAKPAKLPCQNLEEYCVKNQLEIPTIFREEDEDDYSNL